MIYTCIRYSERKLAKLFANSEDPDQMLHSVESDLGLSCLPITRFRVSRLKWVKTYSYDMKSIRKE